MTNIVLFTGKLTLFLSFGAVVALSLRRHSAATRHFVWALTLAGALLFGVAARFAPALPLAIPDWRPEAAAAAQKLSVPDASISRSAVEPRVFLTAPHTDRYSFPSASTLLFIVWVSGVAVILLWLFAGHVALASLTRAASPVTGERWRAVVDDARRILGVARDIRVLVTSRVGAPLTAGALGPVILLPADVEDWPEERRRAAILHEMAHIARHDYVFQLTANLALAFYWFQPLVWLARQRLRRESELATDDRVVVAGMIAPEYARQLVDVAAAANARGFARLVAAGMACPSQLERRLRALLDETRLRGLVSRRLAALTSISLVLLLVPLAAARPASAPKEPPAQRVQTQRATPVATGDGWNREDAYILHSGETDITRTSTSIDEVVAARRRLGTGSYLWVRIGSRQYVIRDESVLRQAVELWRPMEAMKPEEKALSDEERRLDQRIDAIEDGEATAASDELEQLRARDKIVSRRQRELDEREEAMEKVVEARLRQVIEEAIRSGRAKAQ